MIGGPDGGPRDQSVVVACSGGPDSVVAAHLVAEAGVPIVALVHIDHGLRPGSAAEADTVADHAAGLGLPCVRLTVDVARRGSLENNARQARWAALREVASRHRADLIVTGHTADDQAETVLMRLARGTGLAGLAAMRPLADGIWRPLLEWRRQAVRELCAERGWVTVADPSNDDRRFERNRVRLDVLPLLGERAVPALARLARLAADDDDLLMQMAAAAPVTSRPDGTAEVELDWLATAHPALGRRAIRQAAALAGATYGPPADRVDEARAGRAVDLGCGLRSWREAGRLVLGVRPAAGGGEPMENR